MKSVIKIPAEAFCVRFTLLPQVDIHGFEAIIEPDQCELHLRGR